MIPSLLLTLFALPGAPPCTCTCVGPGPLDRAVARAEAVFVGRVRSIDWDSRVQIARVRIRVTRAWKWPGGSRRPPAELVVETAQGPACGAYFNNGEEWLVVAYHDAERRTLSTGQCSGTDQVTSGPEPWQQRTREQVRARLVWLERHVGRASRPGV
jgi:hypothetical protein